ncbi:methyltransferase [Mesorhizobium xinjiangense]|uniref:methyltransferase n=1 Tax=Mesorhizobium xinjiangense TaxID=2678685 RepID=UPI0012EEC48F|nr:methyltransferase [Mesorhizobium xinjiangense]
MQAETHPGDVTIDAFHRGDFWLVQPARGGHRAGMDAMMLAAAVPDGFSGRLADLGAGAGAAGLAVASRCRQAHVVLVEREAAMADCAAQALALAQNSAIAARAEIVRADVGLTGRKRAAAGLSDNSVDFVIMNPPFNSGRDRATPQPLKHSAHVMQEGLFESWTRTAAAIVRAQGGLAVIARPESLAEILAAIQGRFGGAEIKAIHPRSDASAIRVVVRARRGSRKRPVMAAPLFLHERDSNRLSDEADAISNGRASLFGD